MPGLGLKHKLIQILTDTVHTRLASIHDDIGVEKIEPQNYTTIHVQDAGFGVKASGHVASFEELTLGTVLTLHLIGQQ
jgi:hypothetical protein